MSENKRSIGVKSTKSTTNKKHKSVKLKQNKDENFASEKSSENHVKTRRKNRKKEDLVGNTFVVENQVEKVVEKMKNHTEKARKPSLVDKVFSRCGTDVYKVETPVYSRLLNELSRVAKFKNVEQKQGFLTFEAPKKERGEIIALLDNLCYTHNIVCTKGVLNRLSALLKRTGIVVGIFCAVGIFCLYPHFVFTVEYNGIDQNVLDVLSQYGVQQGAFLWHFDEDAIEKSLMSLEGISFASVERVGTRVCVRVEHELAPDGYTSTLGTRVATKDGVVTRVIVYSGTAEVQVGDEVKVGQTLIGDYYLKGEDKIPTVASGDVYVERQVEFERFFPDEYFTQTGESQDVTVVSLFRQSKTPKSKYQYYTTQVSVFKNDFLLPFTVYNWTFFEVKKVQNTLSEEDMKALAFGEVIDNNRFEKVMEKSVNIERVDGGYKVHIILTVEEKQ